MKVKLFLILAAMVASNTLSAQTVTGTVSDSSGPLSGASVVEKGTTNGTQTDFDGQYSIDVESDAVLVVSYIGYKSIESSVDGRSSINLTLEEDAEALEEVVVIGYGTTTIKDATGAVVSVTAEDFNGGIIASPEQLIQGKTAGVQISQSSGAPGAGIDFRIRGTTSVRSNNNPLFVVDGVPLSGGATSPNGQGLGAGTSASSNPLNFLNPSDIESISVLKDASSTAIYGSRGANGVVIITTKSGKTGKGLFEFNSTVSVASPANEYDLLGRNDFLNAVDSFGGDVATADFGGDTNWQDVVTRTVASQNQNLAWSKNYGKGNIRATFGYGKQFGVVENSSLERTSLRVNWNHRFLNDKLKVQVSATGSSIGNEQPLISSSAGNQGDLLGAAYSANPTYPNDSSFDPVNQLNPANMLSEYQSFGLTDRALINASVSYDITPELTAKVNTGFDYSESTQKQALSRNIVGFTNGTAGNGRGAVNDLNRDSKLLEFTLNYKKDFENSNLDILAGYSFQDFGTSGRNVTGWGYSTDNLNTMGDDLEASADQIERGVSGSYQQYGIGTGQTQVFVNRLSPAPVTDNIELPAGGIGVNSLFADTFDNTDELQSFFGRINYSLANKYLFTATVRVDGSSRFGPDNQYGVFPSGAIAWKLHEEGFFGDAVSTLKIRANGGITGNQDGLGYGSFVRRERFGAVGIANDGVINIPGTGAVAFANPELKWEETLNYGLGIDFGFNDDRLSGSIDVYKKETTDLLLNVQAAQPSPQPTFFQNLNATVLNQGIEFAIAYDFVRTEDFNLDASFNIAYNENEIQDFEGQIQAGTIRGQGLTGAFAQILAGNQPLFSYFLRDFGGFDANGQPIGDTQGFVGEDALPDYVGGFSLNASYKNWDFATYLAGQFGFSVYNNTRNAFFVAGALQNGRNVTRDIIGNGESGASAAPVSTRFLEKGDFIRLQNASIGYNFPLSGEGLFKSMRFNLTGQNLFLITDYSGLDPEVSSNPAAGQLLNGLPTAGIDLTAYPSPRTFTLGINVTF